MNPASEFYKDARHKDGLQSWCKGCIKKWSDEHREVKAAYGKAYYQDHREEQLAASKKYRGAHREKSAAYNKKYHAEHRAERDARINARRARYALEGPEIIVTEKKCSKCHNVKAADQFRKNSRVKEDRKSVV